MSKEVWSGPILDNHFHLNPNGRNIEAAKDFAKVGGTDLVLVHCPNFSNLPKTKKEYQLSYESTIEQAQKVRDEVNLGMRVILGPHPAAFAHQCIEWKESEGEAGVQKAMELYRQSIDLAIDFIEEGMAHGLGEIGRPHWEVDEDILQYCNGLLEETLHIAAKKNITVQLHVEGDEKAPYLQIGKMADRVGLSKKNMVRHFAPANVSDELTGGMVPSVILQKGCIETLVASISDCSRGFLLETDYMDDLRRPGAVMGPKTVPKRTQTLFSMGVDEEILYRTHVDLPNELYGPPL
jgi:TatD-related deoxyribonuclease